MKSYEKNLLFNKKTKEEGKAIDMAQFELEMDECYQRNIKYDFKSLQKQVKELTKENLRLNKLLNKRLVPDEPKVKPVSNQTIPIQREISILNRVLAVLDDKERRLLTKVQHDCNITNRECHCALDFLVKYKLVNKQFKGNDYYFIGESNG